MLNIIKRGENEYPEPIKKILDTIKVADTIKSRDLSTMVELVSAKLKEILKFLLNEGLIEESIIKGKKSSRRKHLYSIIEN